MWGRGRRADERFAPPASHAPSTPLHPHVRREAELHFKMACALQFCEAAAEGLDHARCGVG